MRRGDLVITPSGAFHDHGHDGDGPVIWVDGLDVPIVNFLEAGFSEELEGPAQEVTRPDGHTLARYGSGMLPLRAASPFGATSPVFSYPYEKARAALLRVSAATGPDAHVGATLRHANPLDGGWVMPTMATWLTHLPAGFETRAVRSTDGQVAIVAEGEIEVEIAGSTIRAGENDVVAMPGWSWRRIRAARDTILFQFSDRSMQERLGLWREERA
jgi:gentisate 1,2-dioxygenase